MKIYTQVIDIALQSPKRFWVAPYSDFKIGVKIVRKGTPVANEFTVKQGSTTLTADETKVDGFTTYTLKSGATGAIEYVVEVSGVAEKQKITQIVTDSTVFDVGGEGGSEPNDGSLFIYQDGTLKGTFTANQDTNVSVILDSGSIPSRLSVETLSVEYLASPSNEPIQFTSPIESYGDDNGITLHEGNINLGCGGIQLNSAGIDILNGGITMGCGDIDAAYGDITATRGTVKGNIVRGNTMIASQLSATTVSSSEVSTRTITIENVNGSMTITNGDENAERTVEITPDTITMVDGCSEGSIEFRDPDGFVVNGWIVIEDGGITMGPAQYLTFQDSQGNAAFLGFNEVSALLNLLH